MSTVLYPDRQSIFNKVWKHFIVEKNPPGYDGNRCLYDTPSGGCAVGCLLPAEIRPELSPMQCPYDENIWDQISHLFSTEDDGVQDFLTDLQGFHDTSARNNTPGNFTRDFESRLRGFADRERIYIPVAA